jgi:hypothetical protein
MLEYMRVTRNDEAVAGNLRLNRSMSLLRQACSQPEHAAGVTHLSFLNMCLDRGESLSPALAR